MSWLVINKLDGDVLAIPESRIKSLLYRSDKKCCAVRVDDNQYAITVSSTADDIVSGLLIDNVKVKEA